MTSAQKQMYQNNMIFMQNRMHLARVPQGQERDYVRGLLRFMYFDEKHAGGFLLGINLLVVIVMWSVFIQGIFRVVNEGLSIIPVVGMFAFASVWTLMLCVIVRERIKQKEIAQFQSIHVWDVQVINVKGYHGRGATSYLADLVFVDNMVSPTQHKCYLYSIGPYQYGLLVAVYNARGERVQLKLIPRMDMNQKAYSLAMKQLQREMK